MALDGATLHIIADELNKEAVGSRIEKITMPYKDRIILSLSSRGFSKKLLISCNPGSPRINYTIEKYENPITPPMICMLLRKRLTSGRLKEVRQAGLDRVLMLDFECKNELGDDIILTLVVEIMGRLSNIILVGDDKIIECVRRFDPEEGKRFMLPGAKYELPPKQDKVNILENDFSDVIDRLNQTNLPLDDALCRILDGVSPIIARETAYLTLSDPQKPSNMMNKYEYDKLCGNLEALKNEIISHGEPIICCDEKGVPKDFTFIKITQYGSKYSFIKCDSISECIDEFYAKRDNAELIKRQSSDLLKLLGNLSERVDRKIHNRERELSQTMSRERFRIYGELIKANLHMIKPGDSFVTCVNYYDENCKEIRIPLDVTLSPSKNAQKYFTEYRKLSNAAGMLEGLIADAKTEQKYIDSVFDSLVRAKTASDIAAIREELIDSGYVKAAKGKRIKLQKSMPDKYITTDGFEITVGKNNRQNDELTLKASQKTDIWFHTKDIPGSHTVIKSNGTPIDDIPQSTLMTAAFLAAKNSKASASRQVPVDYTLIKYVKKPSGAKPGMVIYTTNRTIYADPQNEDMLSNFKKI